VPNEQENGWDPEPNILEREIPLVPAWYTRHIKIKLYTFLSLIASIEHLLPCSVTKQSANDRVLIGLYY